MTAVDETMEGGTSDTDEHPIIPRSRRRVSADCGDGRRIADHTWARPYPEPGDPRLVVRGEVGDDRSFETSFWLWAAVPGSLTVTVRWHEMGVAETSAVVTDSQLRTAREHIRAFSLKDGDRSRGGRVGSSQGYSSRMRRFSAANSSSVSAPDACRRCTRSS